MIKIANKRVLVSFILATMVCLAACSSDGGQTDEDEPIVIEPGVVNEDNTPDAVSYTHLKSAINMDIS